MPKITNWAKTGNLRWEHEETDAAIQVFIFPGKKDSKGINPKPYLIYSNNGLPAESKFQARKENVPFEEQQEIRELLDEGITYPFSLKEIALHAARSIAKENPSGRIPEEKPGQKRAHANAFDRKITEKLGISDHHTEGAPRRLPDGKYYIRVSTGRMVTESNIQADFYQERYEKEDEFYTVYNPKTDELEKAVPIGTE